MLGSSSAIRIEDGNSHSVVRNSEPDILRRQNITLSPPCKAQAEPSHTAVCQTDFAPHPIALLLSSNAQARNSRPGDAMRVLVIEDDRNLSDLVARDLRAVGYTVDAVDLAESGLHAAIDVAYSAIIVDLRLPDRDGLELVREMRAKGVRAPILILTGRRRVADRVAGLEAGADDYLVKPFALAELRARLSALGRRPVTLTSAAPSFADIAFDARGMEATVMGRPLSLSRQELRLLRLLVDRGGHVISKRLIEESLYGFGEEVASNAIEVHIHKLRRALRQAGSKAAIETRRGVGYRLEGKPT